MAGDGYPSNFEGLCGPQLTQLRLSLARASGLAGWAPQLGGLERVDLHLEGSMGASQKCEEQRRTAAEAAAGALAALPRLREVGLTWQRGLEGLQAGGALAPPEREWVPGLLRERLPGVHVALGGAVRVRDAFSCMH